MAIPLLIAGGVIAATGIASAVANANAAAKAAKAQKDAAAQAQDLQSQMWQKQQADQQPWLNAGQTSLASMLRMTQAGYDPSELANDPGFQFRMAQGQQALERSAAARGGLNSGGFMKGLARYSQGVASEEFGNRYNRLASLAGMGQTATNNVGAMGGQYANNMGSLYGSIGNANAANATAQGNAWANGFGAIGQGAAMAAGGGGFGGMAGMQIPQQQIPQQAPGPWAGGYVYPR